MNNKIKLTTTLLVLFTMMASCKKDSFSPKIIFSQQGEIISDDTIPAYLGQSDTLTIETFTDLNANPVYHRRHNDNMEETLTPASSDLSVVEQSFSDVRTDKVEISTLFNPDEYTKGDVISIAVQISTMNGASLQDEVYYVVQ